MAWSLNTLERFKIRRDRHGFSASPLVFGEKLVVCADRVIVLDKADAQVLSVSKPLGALYSTPSVLRSAGQEWLAVFTEAALLLLNGDTFEEAARYPWNKVKNHVNAATPVIVGSQVFISSAYDQGCALLDWREGELELVFESRVMQNKMAGCVLWDGHLYGFDGSMLKCLDLAGNERWRVRGLGNGSLMASDGRLLILNSRGELIVAEASPEEFRERSRRKVLEGGVYWSTPVLWQGRIYCRNSLGDLVCLDHRPTDRPSSSVTRANSPPPWPSADDLFRRHLAAVGGAETLHGQRSMTLKGTFVRNSVASLPAPWRVDHLAPNRWHWIVQPTPPDPRRVERFFDGTLGWELNPYTESSLLKGAALEELRNAPSFHAEADFEEIYGTRETRTVEKFGGVRCYRVEATNSSGAARQLFFEIESGLMRGRAAEGEAIVIYDRHREFDGRLVATTIKRFESGTGTENTYRVETVEFDRVGAEFFQRGEVVEQLLRDEETH